MNNHLELTILIFLCYVNKESQSVNLDNYFPGLIRIVDFVKDVSLELFGAPSENANNVFLAQAMHKIQEKLDDNVPFPCPLNNTRSKKRPTSVHALRPGDIDIVTAFGDSIVAGNSLVATNVFQVGLQNRGLSAFIGGQGTWRQYVTIPNILKEFNPHLIGYSYKDSFYHHNGSQFNFAEAGTISVDMPAMAKTLSRKIKKDPRVNFEKDWKMVSFMIGSNNFCNYMCYENPESFLANHRSDLIMTLRILRDNLPRTFVNVVIPPDVMLIHRLTTSNAPFLCDFAHHFACNCLFSPIFQHRLKEFARIIMRWKQIDNEVVNNPEFDTKTFTAVLQPFLHKYEISTTKDGLSDYSALSADCFHLSQRESGRASTALWNNILEPVGEKSIKGNKIFDFKCPTADNPYLFTRRNSPNFNRTIIT